MTMRKFTPRGPSARSLFSLVFALSLSPAVALAQGECQADADCADGLLCEVVGGSSCGSPAACAPGEECSPAPPCETEELFGCVPGPCASDADCAEGLSCLTESWDDCAAVACAPGQECPQPECEPRSESFCVPTWLEHCFVIVSL